MHFFFLPIFSFFVVLTSSISISTAYIQRSRVKKSLVFYLQFQLLKILFTKNFVTWEEFFFDKLNGNFQSMYNSREKAFLLSNLFKTDGIEKHFHVQRMMKIIFFPLLSTHSANSDISSGYNYYLF